MRLLDPRLLTIDQKSLSMGMNTGRFTFPLSGVDWCIEDVRPSEGEGVLDLCIDLGERNIVCSGSLNADFITLCARCLEPASFPVTEAVNRVYSSDPRIVEETDAMPVELWDGGLVILDALREAVVLSIPGKPLCSPDCPGICYN